MHILGGFNRSSVREPVRAGNPPVSREKWVGEDIEERTELEKVLNGWERRNPWSTAQW